MTPNEFSDWWRDYAAKFPSVAKWLERLGPDGTAAQLALWRDVLAKTPFRAALKVSHAMAHGDLEPVGHWDADRERTAVTVKRAAARMIEARTPKTDAGPPRPIFPRGHRKSQAEPVSLRQAIERVQRLVASGRCNSQASAEAIPDDEGGYRARCRDCRDSGYVTVWSSHTLRAYREDPELLDEKGHRRTCLAPCHCTAGMPKVWTSEANPPKAWAGWIGAESIYDPDRHCVVMGHKHSDLAREHLVSWAERFFENHDPPVQSDLFEGTA